MINRRRPIQSVVEGRKLFANGGMATQQPMGGPPPPPMGQPMGGPLQMGPPMGGPPMGPPMGGPPMGPPPMGPPMGPPPMGGPPMGPPPMGILNSSPELSQAASFTKSPPLLDSLVDEMASGYEQGLAAKTAMNNAPVPMAHGGIVQGFNNGGGNFASPVGRRTSVGPGSSYEDLLARAMMDSKAFPGELTKAMFPYEASLTGGFSGPQKMRPGVIGLDPGDKKPIAAAVEAPLAYIDQLARGLSQISTSVGRSMVDFGEFALTTKPAETDYTNFYSQISTVNDLLRRMPNIKGVSSNDLAADITGIAKQIINGSPNISGTDLSDTVSEQIRVKYDDPVLEQYDLSQEGGGFSTEAEQADAFLSMKIKRLYSSMPDEQINEIIEARKLNPDSSIEEIVTMSFPPDVVANFKAYPEIDDDAEDSYPVNFRGETSSVVENRTAPPPTEKPTGPDEYGTREGPYGTYMSDEDAREDILSGELRQKIGDFEGKKTKEENERNMKFFMDRFKEHVPEYEGMSESEKWFSVAEAGLRVMAGKSPNAITNIAEGLKGLGPELAKDAKERRAYDRQINLSAAKYALEGMEKLRTEERALAAEGRKRPYKLVAMEAFTYEGQNFKKGQAFPATEQQIRDGLFKKLPVTFTETFIADAKATAAAAKKALGGRTSAESFTKVQGRYLDDLDNFKSGVRMKAVLRESARLATSGEVLGGTALLKDYANKAMNSLGIQMKDRTKFLQKYSSTAREDYSAKQKRLGTLMATQLLRESSKTLSDYDRKRVEELIGALTGVGESLWASEDVLKDRLINLEMSIDDGIRRSSNSMLATEDLWRREVTKGGTAIFPVLLDARRRGLGQTTQLGGSSRAKSYLLSDIYNLKTKKFKKGFLSGVNK